MAIGFLPNGVPLKTAIADNASDKEIAEWWENRLELNSDEISERYDRSRR